MFRYLISHLSSDAMQITPFLAVIDGRPSIGLLRGHPSVAPDICGTRLSLHFIGSFWNKPGPAFLLEHGCENLTFFPH